MSTTETARPTDPHATFDRPTATFPTGQWLAGQSAHHERLAGLWADRTPTEILPVAPTASARPRKHSPRRPDGPSLRARRRALWAPAIARHLRAALTAVALAAAILIPMQLFAAQGISSARQAALEARSDRASHTQPEQASPEASPEASPCLLYTSPSPRDS